MANKLIVAPAPHVQTAQSTTRIMRDVVIALMPALVVSAVVFGLDVLRVTALSVEMCIRDRPWSLCGSSNGGLR